MLRRLLVLALAGAVISSVADHATADDIQSLLKEGASLTSAEVAALEAQLEDDPSNMLTRARLLGYYGDRTRYLDSSSRERRHALVLWLFQNAPNSILLSVLPPPTKEIDPYDNPEAYIGGKRAFLAHLENEPNDLTLLGHAAQFLGLQDRGLAIELLERAQSLDSLNPRWAFELGFNHYLDIRLGSMEPNVEAAKKAVNQYGRAIELSPDRLSLSRLQYAAEAAIFVNELDKAREFANLMLTDDRRGPFTEAGIHYGNITLGKIALAEGDVQGAASYLLLAGSAPASRRAILGGPDTSLAKQLLEEGEAESVLQYFDQCARFWERGRDRLKEWAIVVRGGGIPSSPFFGR